jgi:hypothetical protein
MCFSEMGNARQGANASCESCQVLEKAQNGNGQLLEKVGMDLGLAPLPLGFGATSAWVWRHVGLGSTGPCYAIGAPSASSDVLRKTSAVSQAPLTSDGAPTMARSACRSGSPRQSEPREQNLRSPIASRQRNRPAKRFRRSRPASLGEAFGGRQGLAVEHDLHGFLPNWTTALRRLAGGVPGVSSTSVAP